MKIQAAALALCLSLSAACRAAVIYVDADAVAGANDGTSWTNAYTDLQSALAVATSADEIWAAEGTYLPSLEATPGDPRSRTFALVEGVALYGGFAGYGEPDPDERDPAAHVTILSGDLSGDDDPTKALDDPARNNGENSYHVVVGASNAMLGGFAVRGGRTEG